MTSATVGLVKQTINKYYELTDSFEVYSIAIGKSSTLLVHVLTFTPCSSTSMTQACIHTSRMLTGRSSGLTLQISWSGTHLSVYIS